MSKKLVFISDTHHQDVPQLPLGDVLVYCGDWSGGGYHKNHRQQSLAQLEHFCGQVEAWRGKFGAIIVIAGNHDFIAEQDDALTREMIEAVGAIYLNDSGCECYGLKFWGSPIQPWFYSWAFNRKRGEEIRKHWQLIPEGIDVLITHGPPHGILDQTCRLGHPHVGCEELLLAVQRLKPRIHAFGHIHEAQGQVKVGDTLFVNASVLDENYHLRNCGVVLEV